MESKKNRRIDHDGPVRSAFEKQKRKLMKLQPQPCPLCGQPIDYTIKYPDPMSATIDHIIPISRGGHPSDPSNLQVVHRNCNLKKQNKMQSGKFVGNPNVIGNRNLPLSMDWAHYRDPDGDNK